LYRRDPDRSDHQFDQLRGAHGTSLPPPRNGPA
jgi:hypothetical protein